MTALNLTQEQKSILKSFEDLEKDLQYLPISEEFLKISNKQSQQSQSSPYHQPRSIPGIEPSHSSYSIDHIELSRKLMDYKKKSMVVTSISSLLHQYDLNFKHLKKQKIELLELIGSVHRETSDLITKQKKYIDLANAVKQALDYYLLLDKFQFNWVCQVSARQIFEDQLQPMLSQLTDGIEFFTLNSNYSQAKKYLSGLTASKIKVTSFTKSFFIKLLNKEYGFCIKNTKSQLPKLIEHFYPKSKPQFLSQFLSCFPQLQKELKSILLSTREYNNELQTNQLIRKENEIDQFILTDVSLSLISYTQRNIPDVYQEVILKFFAFYRTTFHEGFHRKIEIRTDQGKFQDFFRQVVIQSFYILTCQAAYIQYCFRPFTQVAKQYASGTLTKISQFYTAYLVKLAKEPGKNKDPFKICNQVTFTLEECDKFFRNYLSGQYQSYVIGAIIKYVDQFGIQTLKALFKKISKKIIQQLENVCQNMLPKYKQTNNREKLTSQIKQFVEMIPNLSYCPSQAQRYLITSLDTIIKSIKQVSSKFQSRFECYAWNIEIFALIQHNLDKLPYSLIKKQVKIDIGQTASMFERVKNVVRTDNLLKYASDLISVVKTGVPTLSQLTLDFHSFIKQYYLQLRQKFIKDMVFIHAKNVIQFLQSAKQLSPQQRQNIFEANIVKNLQTSYILSIENFVNSCNSIIELRQKQFALFIGGEENLLKLLEEIKQALLDLMGTFYVEASKHNTETGAFENISQIRERFVWINRKRSLKSE